MQMHAEARYMQLGMYLHRRGTCMYSERLLCGLYCTRGYIIHMYIMYIHYTATVQEELDAPGEWFHDPVASKLFFYPNGTDATAKDIVAPVLSALFRVSSSDTI